MSKADFRKALKEGVPYFRPFMACRKSWPHIYWFQQKLINLVKSVGDIKHVNILEIGSWAGASTFSWCCAIDRQFGGRGHVTSVDIWEEWKDQDADKLSIQEIFHHNINAGGFSNKIEAIKSLYDFKAVLGALIVGFKRRNQFKIFIYVQVFLGRCKIRDHDMIENPLSIGKISSVQSASN